MTISEGKYQEHYGPDADGPPPPDSIPDLPAIWITKDGRRIPIVDMGDGHIVNTIRMLRRTCRDTSRDEVYLTVPGSLRGEHAIDAAWGEFDHHFSKPAPPPQLETLCAEAKRRGLNCK